MFGIQTSRLYIHYTCLLPQLIFQRNHLVRNGPQAEVGGRILHQPRGRRSKRLNVGVDRILCRRYEGWRSFLDKTLLSAAAKVWSPFTIVVAGRPLGFVSSILSVAVGSAFTIGNAVTLSCVKITRAFGSSVFGGSLVVHGPLHIYSGHGCVDN